MTRRENSKAETRELILNAARQLFWERGAENCTIRSIAKEAGVAPASVIVHFKNKTALLEATLSEEIETVLQGATETLPVHDGLQAILVHLTSGMFLLYDKNRELYRILVRDTLFEPIHNSPKIAQLDEKYFSLLADLIESEKKLGKIKPEIDTNIVTTTLFSLYLGVLRDFLRNKELSAETAIKTLSTMLEHHLSGILAPENN